MLRTSLILLLFAPTAFSQGAPTSMTDGTEAALLGTAVLATVGGTAFLIRLSDWMDSPLPYYALPFPSVVATCAMGSALSLSGSCSTTAYKTMLWSVPGYALMGIGLSMRSWDGLGAFLLGGLWLVVAPPLAAVETYRASVNLAVVTDPAGGRPAPGLRLQFGF